MRRAQVFENGDLKMRCFFHISGNGTTYKDEKGTVLSGPEEARLKVAAIAADLAEDGDDYCGFVVRAVTEEGEEIVTVPVVPAPEGIQ
jgi:hypothetical protein